MTLNCRLVPFLVVGYVVHRYVPAHLSFLRFQGALSKALRPFVLDQLCERLQPFQQTTCRGKVSGTVQHLADYRHKSI